MTVYALKQGKRYIGWTWTTGLASKGWRQFRWCDVDAAEKFDNVADAGFFADQYGFVDAVITPVTPVSGPTDDGGTSMRCAA